MRLLRTSLAAVLLCVTVAFAGPPMSHLTVHVESAESGKPIDRASVVLKFITGRAPMKLYKKMTDTWETRTNQEGDAMLPPIPQGTVRVQVIASNYQTFGQMMEVDSDPKTLSIKLNPPQPQYSVK